MATNRVKQLIYRIQMSALKFKIVVIIGCGRIGSNVAVQLPRIGVQNMIFIDNDRVEPSNVEEPGTTAFDWNDIGKYKVDALTEKIRKSHPKARISTYRRRISFNMPSEELNRMLGAGVIIVFAIDTKEGLKVLENPNMMMMLTRFILVPQMHRDLDPNKFSSGISITFPYLLPCMRHTLGFGFDEIRESRASEAINITVNDIQVISDSTTKLIESMLFKRFGNSFKDIDFSKTNYIHIERLKNNTYRRMFFQSRKHPHCSLCGANLFPIN